MKNPVLCYKLGQSSGNPAGNVLEEVAQQEMNAVGGSLVAQGIRSWWNDFSDRLGNKGRFCTLTVECMPSCN